MKKLSTIQFDELLLTTFYSTINQLKCINEDTEIPMELKYDINFCTEVCEDVVMDTLIYEKGYTLQGMSRYEAEEYCDIIKQLIHRQITKTMVSEDI
jgi:hypothetical protein